MFDLTFLTRWLLVSYENFFTNLAKIALYESEKTFFLRGLFFFENIIFTDVFRTFEKISYWNFEFVYGNSENENEKNEKVHGGLACFG